MAVLTIDSSNRAHDCIACEASFRQHLNSRSERHITGGKQASGVSADPRRGHVSLAPAPAVPNRNDESNSKQSNHHPVTSKAPPSTPKQVSYGTDCQGPRKPDDPTPASSKSSPSRELLQFQDVEDSDDDYEEENENTANTLEDLLLLVKGVQFGGRFGRCW